MKNVAIRTGLAIAVGVVSLLICGSAWGAVGVDVSVSGNQGTAKTTVATPAFSTTSANELLLAFISADKVQTASTTVTQVTGAGLAWVLVQRTNVQAGTAEIWRAFASTTLSGVTVTATLSQSVVSSITVMSFSGVDTTGTSGAGAIGAVGTGNANPGVPTATLVTTRNGSLVVGVGNDWDRAVARTAGAGQTLVHQYLASVGDTYWVQMQSSPTTLSGTSVTINDTAPTNDRFNLSIAEVLPVSGGGTSGSISGTIGPAASGNGATVTLSQGTTTIATTTAGTTGSYSFLSVANGTYTVTPSKTGFTFGPASQSATVNGNAVTVPAFTATATTGTISGTITPGASGNGATVTLSQGTTTVATTTAGTTGSYSFANVANGTYTVTPSETGFTFNPTSQSATVNGNAVTVPAFTATATTGTISGTITPGASGNGATVTLSQGTTTIATTTAGTTGSYSFLSVANGTYTVTPSETGFTFNPTSQSATVNGNAVTVPAFTATALTWSVSGTITPAGAGVGTTLTLSQNAATIATTTGDASGNYSFVNIANGTYTVTPTKSGYTFSPLSQSVTVNNGNSAVSVFTATQVAGGSLVHVGGTSAHPRVSNQTITFNYSPAGSNDALVLMVGCRGAGITSMTLTAPGWTFTPISGLVGPSSFQDFVSTFGAITPSTAPTTFTVTLTGGDGTCSGGDTTVMVDEFSGNDVTGGTTTFDAHGESLDNGTLGICTGAPITPVNNNDAIWYGCFDNVTGVSGGYTKGQDDTTGDWTEYLFLSGGAGVPQNPGFITNPNFFSFGLGGVSIKPAPASGAPDLTISKSHAGNFTQGQTGASYTITASNVGSLGTSGAVSVTDNLPAGLTATAIGGTNWTCTLGTLTCTRSDVLAAGASYAAITITVNVASNAPTSVTNTATVSGGGETNTTNDTASDVTSISIANAPGIQRIQSNVNGSESGTSNMSVSFTSNNTAGNFLIVTGSAARPASTLTIADTLGNSYATAMGPVTDTTQNVTIYVWYVANCKQGANTVTITPSTTAALEIHVSEWAGLATISPVDQTVSATGNGTAVSSGAQTTTINGDLIFGYGWVFNTASAGTGFTPISLVNGDLDEYEIQPSAGSVAATFSQTSGTWFALMVAFKPLGGTGPNQWNITGNISPTTGGSGATVTLSGASSTTAITDSNGNYAFSGLANGSYTVTPSNPGYTFTPSSQAENINGANLANVNFTATAVPQSLVVFPTGMVISGNLGGSNPNSAIANVSNSGGGTLSFTASSDSAWLSVTPASGTGAQSLQISADNTGLALGTYTGHVTITEAGAQGSPFTVPVIFNVGMVTDWLTIDHDSGRSGNAADETLLTTANVVNLQLNWSATLDGNIVAQPLYVHNIQVGGLTRDVLIVGTGGNSIYALDASNGSVLWTRNFGAPTPNTWGLPDGFGIEAPPYIDRITGRIYTVSTDGNFRVISLFDGTDVFPALPLIANPATNKVWGGLNRVGNSIYVASASNGGDVAPWRGQVYGIDVSGTPTLTGNFVVVPSIAAPNGGGGIWGYGGVSADLSLGNIFATTAFDSNVSGNGNENTALYSNSVIALSSSLSLQGYFQGPQPSTIPCNGAPCDLDFASTPVIFQPTGCPTMTAAGSKNGNLYLFRTADLVASGQPLQILSLNAPQDSLGSGGVGGVPAWSAANNMLYITDAGPGVTGISAGVVGLKVTSGCTLQVAWSNALGGNDTPNSGVTIANGVVFVGQGNTGVIHAYDAKTGSQLWQSGSQYKGVATFAAPTVAGGRLYVGSWTSFSGGGIVGAFSAPTQPILGVSPQSVGFSAATGGSNPAPANISISNTGAGTLNFTASSDSAWLIVSPTSGTAPATIQATASIAGMNTGTYTGHITVVGTGAQNSPLVVTVTLNIGTAPPALAIDAKASKDNGSKSLTIVSPTISTTAANELLVALISTDYVSGSNTTVTGVSGGGLTWTLVGRSNAQSGTSEIWRAFATTQLSSVTITASLSQSVAASMTVMSFAGADPSGVNGAGAIGATKTASAGSGAPTASLVTTRNGSWVIGVGNDFDNAIARTPGSGQTVVHQYLAPVGDTYWVQMQNATTTTNGSLVTINDTGPTGDRYNLVICEILAAP